MLLFWIVKYNIKNKVYNIDNNYQLKGVSLCITIEEKE